MSGRKLIMLVVIISLIFIIAYAGRQQEKKHPEVEPTKKSMGLVAATVAERPVRHPTDRRKPTPRPTRSLPPIVWQSGMPWPTHWASPAPTATP